MKKKKICLDPGHYGTHYNAGSIKGYYESEIVWKLTMMEKDILEKMGIEVVLTRSNINDNPGLYNRGKASKDCDLFVSNHTNACGNPLATKAIGIYLVGREDTTIDDKSKEFANKLAAVVDKAMGNVGHETWSRLADKKDLDGNGKFDDNYYGVLHGCFLVGVPGIIIEHSFHTNDDTCRWLMNDENLLKLATECAQCMADYLEVNETVEEHASVISVPVKEVFKPYYVKVSTPNLNIRIGPGTNFKKAGIFTGIGIFTIVEEAKGEGSTRGWGKLKSGAGWISLDYTTVLK